MGFVVVGLATLVLTTSVLAIYLMRRVHVEQVGKIAPTDAELEAAIPSNCSRTAPMPYDGHESVEPRAIGAREPID